LILYLGPTSRYVTVCKSARLSFSKNILVSSANMVTLARSDTFTRSLIYKRKRRGTRTDRCGTPREITAKSEFEDAV